MALEIKYLYFNLTMKNIFYITEYWISKCNRDHITTEQTLHLLEVIFKQKNFK